MLKIVALRPEAEGAWTFSACAELSARFNLKVVFEAENAGYGTAQMLIRVLVRLVDNAFELQS